MKNLKVNLVRAISGSGKTFLARKLVEEFLSNYNLSVIRTHQHIEADQWFNRNGKYEFDVKELDNAHRWCQLNFEHFIRSTDLRHSNLLVVSNTFTTAREILPYLRILNKYNVSVVDIKEPETIWWQTRDIEELVRRNVHKVPRETIVKQLQRYVALPVGSHNVVNLIDSLEKIA